MERWDDYGTWRWHDHGRPASGVNATTVGAPMAPSGKVFANCDDGSLRQLHWNGHGWHWFNHGHPGPWEVDTTPVSISGGKVFVTGSSGGTRVLLQLYWTGSAWWWFNHGTPGPNINIDGGATANYDADRVVVQDDDGNIHMLLWYGSTWAWRDLGRPSGPCVIGPCPADLTGDGFVDVLDLFRLLELWGTPEGDIDGDGDTNFADLTAMFEAWGACA